MMKKFFAVLLVLLVGVGFYFADQIKLFMEFNNTLDSMLHAAKVAPKDERELVLISDLKGFEYEGSDRIAGVEIKGVKYLVSKVSSLSQLISVNNSSEIYLYRSKAKSELSLSGALCFASGDESECFPMMDLSKVKSCERVSQTSGLACESVKEQL